LPLLETHNAAVYGDFEFHLVQHDAELLMANAQLSGGWIPDDSPTKLGDRDVVRKQGTGSKKQGAAQKYTASMVHDPLNPAFPSY
jgi:hypothetical protein